MGLVLSFEEIQEHMNQHGLWNSYTEQTVIYAQVNPTAGQVFLFGGYAQLLKGQYYVMSLEKDRIILLPLGKLSGKIDKKLDPVIIPHEELEGIYIKKGKMMNTVILLGEEEELPLKISKVVMGMKWHKERLDFTMQELEKLQEVVGNGEH